MMNGEYPAPLRIYVPSVIFPDREGVVKITVDLYQSIYATELQHINYWVLTYRVFDCAYFDMAWWFHIC
jgi:hypothetical protein